MNHGESLHACSPTPWRGPFARWGTRSRCCRRASSADPATSRERTWIGSDGSALPSNAAATDRLGGDRTRPASVAWLRGHRHRWSIVSPTTRGASSPRAAAPCTRRWCFAPTNRRRGRVWWHALVARSPVASARDGAPTRVPARAAPEGERRGVEFQASERLKDAANVMSVIPIAVQLRFRRQCSRSSRCSRQRW